MTRLHQDQSSNSGGRYHHILKYNLAYEIIVNIVFQSSLMFPPLTARNIMKALEIKLGQLPIR